MSAEGLPQTRASRATRPFAQRQFAQLVRYRLLRILRDREYLIWGFVFPTIMASVLALAFRPSPLEPVRVVVVEAAGADALEQRLRGASELVLERATEADALAKLARGTAGVVVRPGEPPTVLEAPAREDSRAGRLLVERALSGAPTAVLERREVEQPGARYVDFLIPGLLALTLMMNSLNQVGLSLAEMKRGKLLKRLAASPLSRAQFYLSLALARLVVALFECSFFLLLGRLAFGVPIQGSLVEIVAFALVASGSFAMISLVMGLLAKTFETYSGLNSLFTTPMVVASGVFFSSEKFPQLVQPLLKVLPLTALADGLRALILEGRPLTSLWFELAVLAVWGLVPYLLSLRALKWV